MNKIIGTICLLAWFYACAPATQTSTVKACADSENAVHSYKKADKLQTVMQDMVNQGVPGIAAAVISPEGNWTGSAGWASIEQKIPMKPCHLQYLQSISKTYMAVAIMMLKEQGKIDLDKPITHYLKPLHSQTVKDAEKITVRMLLNHTSGIPDYNFSPAYVAFLLQHPTHVFTPEDYLAYIKGKSADFEPGTKYAYRNVNYVLLALMADHITGDHAAFISQHIFKALRLSNTFYRSDSGYLHYAHLPASYWDRNSNGMLEDASTLQRNNVANMIGDDGIVTTPQDAVLFLQGLVTGKLVTQTSLQEMRTWVKDSKGKDRYGMGLATIQQSGVNGYGHSGGGIGAGCELYYFPAQNLYFFIGINLGTVTESPLHEALEKTREALYKTLLEE
jgi:D-alanyl-D-alanine carboxypeptidase